MSLVFKGEYDKEELNGFSREEIRVEGLEGCIEVFCKDKLLREELVKIKDIDHRRERFISYVQEVLNRANPICRKYIGRYYLDKIASEFEDKTGIKLGYL